MGGGCDMHGLMRGRWWHRKPSPETTVFLLELLDSPLEVAVLGFPTISAVLGGDAITVSASLLALLRCELGACALAG